MRKKLIPLLLTASLAGGLPAGCNKELPGGAGHDDGDEPLVKMELRCKVEPLVSVETKAGSADDRVYRLDILEYDSSYSLQGHHTFQNAEGIDLDSFVFEQWLPSGSIRYYALLANLEENTVNYIKATSTNYWHTSYNAVPLGAGNYSAGHIPMGCWAYCDFYGTSPTAQLCRYMFRIDIGTVTADFGAELMAKTVRVKSISIINACQLFYLANRPYSRNSSFSPDPMGYKADITDCNPFGGITTGYSSCNSISTSLSESTVWNYAALGGEGILGASFPALYNYNANKEKHVLNITATGGLMDISYYSVPTDEGGLAPLGSHVYSVERSFYGVPRHSLYSGYYTATVLEDYRSQSDYMKLVTEVEVDGVTYYYPILLRCMQPNTLYTIRNITLKGPGSEYSNFYERYYSGSVTASSALEWTDFTIDNINLGYADDTGTAIF